MNRSIPKISIAMATFNGEKYVRQQLESLAGQVFKPFELVICDDGSTDKTLDIILDFQKVSPFPVRLIRNEQTLGFSDNFLKCASLCDGDWISFCDQDDFWLPNKLRDVVSAIAERPEISLVLQSSHICDADLKLKDKNFPGFLRPGIYGRQTQFGFWVWPGFLQSFRASLLRDLASLRRPRSYYPAHSVMPHDKLICLLANAVGDIMVLNEPAAFYRRHPDAVTGTFSKVSVGAGINKAMSVGFAHYRFLEEVALETSDYLSRAADVSDNVTSLHFQESATLFLKISKIYSCRSILYSRVSFITRFRCFLDILFIGGYFGPAMISLKWKSFVKDFAFVVIGKKDQKSVGLK